MGISKNINAIIGQILDEWQAHDGFAKTWQVIGKDNEIFRNRDEQLGALLKLITQGLKIIIEQRLKPVIASHKLNPKRKLLWRSNEFEPILRENIKALGDLLNQSGLFSLLSISGNKFETKSPILAKIQ